MTAEAVHQDLASMSDAVAIVDATRAIVAGIQVDLTEYPATDGSRDESPDPEMALAAAIYRHCYLRPSGRAPLTVVDVDRDRRFQASLAVAGANAWAWESGWRWVRTAEDGRMVVRRHGVLFWAQAAAVRPSVTHLAPGDPCEVLAPRERRSLPGFHVLAGCEPWTTADDPPAMVRVYWHIRATSAARLLGTIESTLNEARVSFVIKVLRNPAAYSRADAAVLYLPKPSFVQARDLLASVHQQFAPELRDSVPLLTKRLGRGLGLAEDPGLGLSFGQHRCRIVARSLWQAHGAQREGTDGSREAKLAAIAAAFRAERLDPGVPYLSPGSHDHYQLAPVATSAAPPPAIPRPENIGTTRSAADVGTLLSAAQQIGQAVCEAALWNRTDARCTWIARTTSGTPGPGDTFRPRSATLGPDLYAGTSGIALFLAELFIRTGEDSFAQTARGAIGSALHQARRAEHQGIGLYTGMTGVVLAAQRVMRLLGDKPGQDRLVVLLDSALARRSPLTGDDLLAGRAGAIVSLLTLAREDGWSACRGRARELGEEMVRSISTHGPAGRGWTETQPPLTGLSHGAAGVAFSLLALGAETGNEMFVSTARASFDYEQGVFDDAVGNWPDLRELEQRPSNGPRFMTAWCHGAPGIALSRLRARTFDPSRQSDYDRQAAVALSTTLDELHRRRPLDDWDVTPCHGVTGLIDSLWIGGRTLDCPELSAAALQAALNLARHSVSDLRSGVPGGGTNPSLMLGTAGVGYQLLRVADPARVPSVLLGLWQTHDDSPTK